MPGGGAEGTRVIGLCGMSDVGVASPGKVWGFFLPLFSRGGNFGLPRIPPNCLDPHQAVSATVPVLNMQYYVLSTV